MVLKTTSYYYPEPYDRITGLRNLPYRSIRKFLTKSQKYPRFLYKYKTYKEDHLRDLIVNSVFYMSSNTEFNDPYDCTSNLIFKNTGDTRVSYLNHLKKVNNLKYHEFKLLEKRLSSPGKIESELEKARQTVIKNSGIFSFATKKDNLLMWSHYANSHKGICLIFDISRDIDVFVQALPVKYSAEFPTINHSNFGNKELLIKTFLTKSNVWKYESEHRIINQSRAKQSMFFNPKSLFGLILGEKSSSNDIALVKKLLTERSNSGRPSIRIFKSNLGKFSYELKFNEISIDNI